MSSRYLVYGLVDPRTQEVRYVGKSSSGLRRPHAHFKYEHDGKTPKCIWIRELKALGLEPIIRVLEECSPEKLIEREMYFIQQFSNLTNSTLGGEGGLLGMPCSEETKQKIAAAHRGKKLSEETRMNMSRAGRLKIHSAEHVAKRAAFHRGKKRTAETCERIGAHFRGKKHTKEHNLSIKASTGISVVDVATGAVYLSLREAALGFGVNRGVIRKVIEGRSTYPGIVLRRASGDEILSRIRSTL